MILSGSFNPVHHGHVRLLDHSSSMCNIDKYYEISISNVDKPDINESELEEIFLNFFF